jgi:hypothetical protein
MEDNNQEVEVLGIEENPSEVVEETQIKKRGRKKKEANSTIDEGSEIQEGE